MAALSSVSPAASGLRALFSNGRTRTSRQVKVRDTARTSCQCGEHDGEEHEERRVAHGLEPRWFNSSLD